VTVDTGNLRKWADAVTGWHESGMTLTTMTVAADLAALSRAAADELEQLRAALDAVPHSTLCAFMTTAYEEPCSCPKSLTPQPESDENAWITHELSKRPPTLEQFVALLTVLADGRAEYFHGKEPEHQGDLQSMRFDELIIYAEREAARHIRDIVAGTNDGKGWMPSWRWDELTTALEPIHEGGPR
jgi:hypothetical protein